MERGSPQIPPARRQGLRRAAGLFGVSSTARLLYALVVFLFVTYIVMFVAIYSRIHEPEGVVEEAGISSPEDDVPQPKKRVRRKRPEQLDLGLDPRRTVKIPRKGRPLAQQGAAGGRGRNGRKATRRGPCDGRLTNWTAVGDLPCRKYLGEVRNVLQFIPLKSIHDEARTVKWKVRYKDGRTTAMLKVPQKTFPLEPYSEFMSYKLDRYMKLNKVPPTHYMWAPLSALKQSLVNASEEHSKFVQTEFLRYMKEEAPDVLQREEKPPSSAVAEPTVGGKRWSVLVSVQLWVSDVRPLTQSELATPPEYELYLVTDAFVPPISPAEDLLLYKIMAQVSDQLVFDYILGNIDRTRTKNSYVAGGCGVSPECRKIPASVAHIGPPTLISLDQGWAFNSWTSPDKSPLSRNAGLKMCRFTPHMRAFIRDEGAKGREAVNNELFSTEKVERKDVAGYLMKWAPFEIMHVMGEERIGMVTHRLLDIVDRVKECKEEGASETDLTFWTEEGRASDHEIGLQRKTKKRDLRGG